MCFTTMFILYSRVDNINIIMALAWCHIQRSGGNTVIFLWDFMKTHWDWDGGHKWHNDVTIYLL